MDLVIDSTWDGAPARLDECTSLQLLLTDEVLVIELEAPWHGDPPPAGDPGPTGQLWEHEVVELFVVGADRVLYTEIELGPHGHHLVLRLQGVRNPVEQQLPIAYRATRTGDRWSGHAQIPLDWLPPRPWTLNAYAIHGQGPQRRYLAMTPVPGPEPDFHQPERFTVRFG